MSEKNYPWRCHICDYSSTIGEGLVCSECFMICCNDHITTTTAYNNDSGLYELKLVCVQCQFKKNL
jgi:hypothetical protein